MSGWTRLDEGMEAPEVGGPELTQRRREAISEALRMMACTHPRGEECEHIEAVAELAAMVTITTIHTCKAAIKTLPRPLSVPSVDRILDALEPVTLINQSNAGAPRGFDSD